MKVGVIVPIHGPFKGPEYTAPSYATVKSIYQTAEQVGLDSAWITDHLLFRFPPDNINIHSHEAFTFWAGVAEATSRIELGSLGSVHALSQSGDDGEARRLAERNLE